MEWSERHAIIHGRHWHTPSIVEAYSVLNAGCSKLKLQEIKTHKQMTYFQPRLEHNIASQGLSESLTRPPVENYRRSIWQTIPCPPALAKLGSTIPKCYKLRSSVASLAFFGYFSERYSAGPGALRTTSLNLRSLENTWHASIGFLKHFWQSNNCIAREPGRDFRNVGQGSNLVPICFRHITTLCGLGRAASRSIGFPFFGWHSYTNTFP